MFEIRLSEDWSYWLIYKDDKLFSPYHFKNEWEAIEEVRKFDLEAYNYLYKLHSSIE